MPTAAAPRLAKVLPMSAVVRKPPRVEPPRRDPAQLVEALLAGNVQAQTRLWDLYSVCLRAVLRRTLGPRAEVEDALQEVFIRAFRALPTLRDRAALRSFLIGVAVRVARGALRARRFKRWLMLTDDGLLPEPHAEDPAAAQARRAVVRLYAILDQLDDDSRILFVLRHVEALEIHEIALSLGISVATVKRRLARVTPLVFARARRDGELAAFIASSELPEGDL